MPCSRDTWPFLQSRLCLSCWFRNPMYFKCLLFWLSNPLESIFFPFNKEKKNPLGLLCQSFDKVSNQNIAIYQTRGAFFWLFFNHTCMQVIHIHPYKSRRMSNESGNSFRPQSWSTLGSHTCGICGHTKQILCLSLFPVGRGVFWVIVQSLAGLAAWSCAVFFSIYFKQFFFCPVAHRKQ